MKIWVPNTNDPAISARPVPGGAHKGLRCFPLMLPGDVLVGVPSNMEGIARQAITHLQRVGLGRGVSITYGAVPPLPPGVPVEWFIIGQAAAAHSPILGDLAKEAAALASKNEFIELARRQKWSVPETVIVEYGRYETCPEHLGWPRVIKVDRAVGGKGVFVVYNREESSEVLRAIEGQPYQIQQYLPPECTQYYSVQYCHGHMLVVEQLIVGSSYAGARPVDVNTSRQISDAAESVLEYVSLPVFSVDVAIHKGKVLFLEVNPRYGATTYPWLVARRLNVCEDRWEYRDLPLRYPKALPLLDQLVYNRRRGSGCVVIDWGIPDKYLGILLIGTDKERAQLLEGLQQVL